MPDLQDLLHEATGPVHATFEPDDLKRRAQARARRRRALTAGVVAVFAISLATTLSTGANRDDGHDNAVVAGQPSETTDNGTPSADEDVAYSPSADIQVTVPDGWHLVGGEPYATVEAEPVDQITIATFPFIAEPSPTCDLPVTALEELGPNDALLSVRPSSGPGFDDQRPEPEAFVPTEPPESGYAQCFDDDVSFLFNDMSFTEAGRTYRVIVALGADTSTETRRLLIDLAYSLEVKATSPTPLEVPSPSATPDAGSSIPFTYELAQAPSAPEATTGPISELTVSLDEVPDDLQPGQLAEFTASLHNPTTEPVIFDRCPTYLLAFGDAEIHTLRSHLNCDDDPQLDPDETQHHQMLFIVPTLASSGATLYWQLEPALQAAVTSPITVSAP